MFFTAYRTASVALAGFGLDSLIEIGASLVVVWTLTGTGQEREKKALKWIGIAFFVLAAYVLVQSSRSLILHTQPGTSVAGIVWLAVTFLLMLGLAAGKNRIGKQLGNAVLLTEGKVTLVDACLAGSVLMGVVLNAAFGWWWADRVAGLGAGLLRPERRPGRMCMRHRCC